MLNRVRHDIGVLTPPHTPNQTDVNVQQLPVHHAGIGRLGNMVSVARSGKNLSKKHHLTF